VIPLLPILEVRAFHYEKVVQDRYLYLSMLGFGLLFGVLIDELYKIATRVLAAHPEKRKSLDRITTTIVLGTVVIMGASTVKQNMSWATEWDLWMNANLSSPGSCTANMELGALCEKEEKYQSCPNSLKLQHKLGYIYGRFNDLSKAEEAFQKILVLAKNRSTIATAYKNLGIIYEKRGNLSKAMYYYQKGLELDPFSQTASEVKKIVAELNKKIVQGDKNDN
jgi:tetratricopeptide (TPR) repeat protein